MPLKPLDPFLSALKGSKSYTQLASLLTFISGVLLTWQPIFRHTHYHVVRLEAYFLPPHLQQIADLASVALGLLLTYLAYELLQHKRSAWLVTLAASVVSLLVEIYLRLPLQHEIFPIIVIATLLIGRHQFVVQNPAAYFARSMGALAISVFVALAYGTIGFWLLDHRDIGKTFSLPQALWETLRQYTLIDRGDLAVESHYTTWFLNSLSVVGALTLIYCLVTILRPLRYELSTLPAERNRARKLLEKYGGDTDDYFKLWPEDKSYYFAKDGKAFIAYGVARGVAVAFANPEGDPDSIQKVLQEFTAFCLSNGWLVAFVAAGDRHKAAFDASGYGNILIGADAIIDTGTFLSETARNKYFRNIINRFGKGHFTTTRHMPPHSAELIAELKMVSDDWLRIPDHKEWNFIAGYFSKQYFAETPLFVARDESGQALAFANELPSFKAGEATIDLMRHRRDAPKNIMDFMFISLIRDLHVQGFKHFNLGLSPLARQNFVNKSSERFLDYVYLALQRFISSKGLHQYKSKFEPAWEPRYIYYVGNPSTLPQIGLAVIKLMTYKS